MNIEAWLRSLGLERYEADFRDNEIDWAVLPKLTADDLKDLGVGLVGHRRKLLEAIAELSAADAPPDPTRPTAPSGGSPPPTPGTLSPGHHPGAPPHAAEGRTGAEAERRQLSPRRRSIAISPRRELRIPPAFETTLYPSIALSITGRVQRLKSTDCVEKVDGHSITTHLGNIISPSNRV